MNATNRFAMGRRLGLLACIWSIAYLVWRAGWSWGGSASGIEWWLAAPTFAAEVLGFACTALLIWALARTPSDVSLGDGGLGDGGHSGDGVHEVDYDVAIVVSRRSAADLRATLVALGTQAVAPAIAVIDHRCRPEVFLVASEFGAEYVATVGDPSGMKAAMGAGSSDFVLLLEAGDVAARGAVRLLTPWVRDASVAAVQGVVRTTPIDSGDHDPHQRDHQDFAFEWSVLNPALGARGAGFLLGSGSLIRRSAISSIEIPTGSREAVLWSLTARFAAAGLLVRVATGQPIVAIRPTRAAVAAGAEPSRRGSSAWRLLHGPQGALRRRGLPLRVRLASAAWAVRPLDGLRLAGITAIVLAALLVGRPPFAGDAVAFVGLWAPAFGFATLSVLLLSGFTLRLGDRLRGALGNRRLAVMLLVATNSVLIVRGISDRFTHSMRPLAPIQQVALTAVVLWVVVGCLESLQLLIQRRHARDARRMQAASSSGAWGDSSVSVIDVTMRGAGLLTNCRPQLGERELLAFNVATESGITSLEAIAIVRNVTNIDALADGGGGAAGLWRVGVEFELIGSPALNALAEACVIGPARAALTCAGGDREPAATERAHRPIALDGIDLGAAAGQLSIRRDGLRLATLVAFGGVVSSIASVNGAAIGPLAPQRLLAAILGACAAASLVVAVPWRARLHPPHAAISAVSPNPPIPSIPSIPSITSIQSSQSSPDLAIR